QCCLNRLAARADGMPLRDDGELVVVARHACLRHAVVFYGRLEDLPVAELLDHAALDFLPWRLARRVLESPPFFPRDTAPRRFGRISQHNPPTLVEVDCDAGPRPSHTHPPPP